MDYETLFPGRFIKSADLKGKDVNLVVRGVRAEKIDDKVKAVVTFEGTPKEWVLNRTNAEALKLCFGRDTDDWLGKMITIYPATIKDPFADGDISAIRVRGSPDIVKAMSATVQRGRKTIKVSVVPTGTKAQRPPSNGNGKRHLVAEPTPEEAAEIVATEKAQSAAEGLD